MSVGGDKVAKKIVDLSKRNRELGAELIRLKQTIRDLQSKIMVYEEKDKAFVASHSEESSSKPHEVVQVEQESKHSKRMNDVSSLKVKLSSARNQIELLKQELAVSHKVLAKEVGEGFTVNELLAGTSGWRGRAQQITVLQNKVSELKKQLKGVDGSSHEPLSTGHAVKEKVRIKELEQKRRNELEEKSAELDALRIKHTEVLKQIAALKARNRTLSSQVKSSTKSVSATDSHPPSREVRPCLNCASAKAVYEREMTRKDKEVYALKQELKVYKTKAKSQPEEFRIHSAPGLTFQNTVTGLTSKHAAHGLPVTKHSVSDSVDVAEWSTRARVSEVEKDKLLEMVSLLQQRLDEAVSRLSELSVARPKVSGNTKMSGLKMDGDAELVERLHIQMDENQALKETLSQYQSSKAQDIKLLTELFKQSRLQFSQTIKELKSKLVE